MNTPGQPAAADLADAGELATAAALVVTHQFGNTRFLVHRMGILPSRALELMTQLEHAGVVGSSQGARSRDVLVLPDRLVAVLEELQRGAAP